MDKKENKEELKDEEASQKKLDPDLLVSVTKKKIVAVLGGSSLPLTVMDLILDSVKLQIYLQLGSKNSGDEIKNEEGK